MKLVGVDLGGTEIKVGFVDHEKGILNKFSTPTEVFKGSDTVVNNIIKAINEVSAGEKPQAIGIGSPGSIEREKGIVRYSPNFPDWSDFHLAEEVTKKSGIPAYVENDANAFALGEWFFGGAKGLDHFVALTLGTGVGSGVISHGKFITGKDGIGAELGHVVVEPDGPMCGCGTRGCLEAIVSASSVARRAKEMSLKYKDSEVIVLAGSIEKIESKHVFKAAENGDYMAHIVVEKVVDSLARAIGSYIHIFNPQKIIIGGGMSKAGDALFIPLRKRVNSYLMKSFADTCIIEQSAMVENAGILGAASSAIYRIKGE